MTQAATDGHLLSRGNSGWHERLAKALHEAGVEIGAWVPDKRLAPIASALADQPIPLRTMTREEECIAFAAGYRAAGGSPVVLFQCSGLGNSVNALASLAIPYDLGFPIILSMRGTLGERNPAQVLGGRTAVAILSLLGVQSFPLAAPNTLARTIQGAVALSWDARQVVALPLLPELESE